MPYPRYVSLSDMPSPNKEYVQNFPKLDGGLNLWDLDYRLNPNESPEMENLMWREGTLCSRDGQTSIAFNTTGIVVNAYDKLFHGHIVWASNTAICWHKLDGGFGGYSFQPGTENTMRGSFFLYNDVLYFKGRGIYLAIKYTAGAEEELTVSPVTAYTPVVVINAHPENGSGDLYQPENRLSKLKTVWYNAEEGVTVYHLPVKPIHEVTEVKVDGNVMTLGEDYVFSTTHGTVTFMTAPPVTDPPTNNTVQVTYSKLNLPIYSDLMDCNIAMTYGGAGDLGIVMAGSTVQPNTYFWNGNSAFGMDPGYFPMDQYQLAGSNDEAITGFGKQQSYLVIFKEHSVGRTILNTTEINGRTTIDLPYTAINDKIGCDLPGTIQLIENNLVWCNRQNGVHFLKDSSSAYENNIICISRKVNGNEARPGLLADIRAVPDFVTDEYWEAATERSPMVTAFDDDHRYWLCANDHAWVWDYELSTQSNPSWFYWTNIHTSGMVLDHETVYNLPFFWGITKFTRTYCDERVYSGEDNAPIHKVYRFATQYFGTYDRLKNVNSVILSTRSDTNTDTAIRYITDHEERDDLTPLTVRNWMLSPRNLSFRSLAMIPFAAVFRRKPRCLHIRHFTMRLENNVVGEDMSIVSAQIFYTFQGRQR